MKLCFECPESFLPGLRVLAPRLSFSLARDGVRVRAEEGPTLNILPDGDGFRLVYPSIPAFFHGVSLLVGNPGGAPLSYKPVAKRLGMMMDCSDGLMSVAGLKAMIEEAAILGYDYLGLYLETTYPVDGEPYFGYLSGRYEKEEIAEIVSYASLFGLEIVPFVQTLGHMGSLFRFDHYYPYSDIQDTLLVDYEPTYVLIDKMIASLRSLFKTSRISLGMDESYFMGSGRYRWFVSRDPQDQGQMFLRHLRKVLDIAGKHGFTDPEIWCDNLFEMEFQGYIYPPKVVYHPWPKEILEGIPEGVTFRMWHYAMTSKEEFLRAHSLVKELTPKVSFAGIAHGYGSFAPLNKKSFQSVLPTREGVEATGIQDVLVTRWETCHSPLLDVPCYLAYAEGLARTEGYSIEDRAKTLYGHSWDELLALDEPNEIDFGEKDDGVGEKNLPYYAIFNDPLLGPMDANIPPDAEKRFAELEKRFAKLAETPSLLQGCYAFESAVCTINAKRANLGQKIKKAYDENDEKSLRAIIKSLDGIAVAYDSFRAAYRDHWRSYNKVQGFELFHLYFGGAKERLEDVKARLEEYLDGVVTKIPELEGERLPYSSGTSGRITFQKDVRAIMVGRKMRL